MSRAYNARPSVHKLSTMTPREVWESLSLNPGRVETALRRAVHFPENTKFDERKTLTRRANKVQAHTQGGSTSVREVQPPASRMSMGTVRKPRPAPRFHDHSTTVKPTQVAQRPIEATRRSSQPEVSEQVQPQGIRRLKGVCAVPQSTGTNNPLPRETLRPSHKHVRATSNKERRPVTQDQMPAISQVMQSAETDPSYYINMSVPSLNPATPVRAEQGSFATNNTRRSGALHVPVATSTGTGLHYPTGSNQLYSMLNATSTGVPHAERAIAQAHESVTRRDDTVGQFEVSVACDHLLRGKHAIILHLKHSNLSWASSESPSGAIVLSVGQASETVSSHLRRGMKSTAHFTINYVGHTDVTRRDYDLVAEHFLRELAPALLRCSSLRVTVPSYRNIPGAPLTMNYDALARVLTWEGSRRPYMDIQSRNFLPNLTALHLSGSHYSVHDCLYLLAMNPHLQHFSVASIRLVSNRYPDPPLTLAMPHLETLAVTSSVSLDTLLNQLSCPQLSQFTLTMEASEEGTCQLLRGLASGMVHACTRSRKTFPDVVIRCQPEKQAEVHHHLVPQRFPRQPKLERL